MTYIPSHVQIETVNRYCDARCPMCTIKFVPDWPKNAVDELSFKGQARPAEIMNLDTFKTILSKFQPYVDKIRFVSLHGCGEPLLDKTLPEKIKFAKDLGLKEVGFTSNCSNLTEKTTKRLLEAGLNCIIPSIDGLTKEVHEAIRPRTDYEKIVNNVRHFIEARDRGDFNCKVLVRMVRQQLNAAQWDDYNVFWRALMTSEKGDDVIGMDVHNTGGKVPNYSEMKIGDFSHKEKSWVDHYRSSVDKGHFDDLLKPDEKTGEIFVKASEVENLGGCPDLFTRLSIFASGDVALCSADQAGFFKIGNVIEEDPIVTFNNEHFTRYRQKWLSNGVGDLDHCRNCTVPMSRFHKTYVS